MDIRYVASPCPRRISVEFYWSVQLKVKCSELLLHKFYIVFTYPLQLGVRIDATGCGLGAGPLRLASDKPNDFNSNRADFYPLPLANGIRS